MGLLAPASMERIVAARRAYFDDGREDGSLIDPAIYRSWSRCIAAARSESEAIAFEQVGRSRLSELVQRNRMLLEAGTGPVADLEKAIAGAGYAVLLTDSRGYAISVGGALEQQHPEIRQAIRPGVDLSEGAIGTSAMACALKERRPVRVFGPEHFFSANKLFHCAAAPIVDPRGGLIGTVDITRGSSHADFGALSLVTRCAHAIEYELFRRIPARAIVTLAWQPHSTEPSADLILAFGDDGEILATNEATRRFMGVDTYQIGLQYEDLFEGRFGTTLTLLQGARGAIPVQLRSGICMYASLWAREGQGAGLAAPAAVAVAGAGRAVRLKPASVPDTTTSDFGDGRINEELEIGLKALHSGLPVLVLGETGTGKDVVARALHERSTRRDAAFVAINCAAIPESLIESELFGYEEGAFTGARRGGAAGRIEQAGGGTLFLDEIGDMPLHLQARLLRVLESKEVSRLGGSATQRVDFQLVCATHQDIEQAVREGRFRRDLYYRINAFVLTLSPLRLRPHLKALACSILAGLSDGARSFSPEALERLAAYPWPGNVREFRNAIIYAHAIAPAGERIGAGHFPRSVLVPVLPEGTATGGGQAGVLASLEREAMRRALDECAGNVRLAAKRLGISRATLYRRIHSGEV
ncbi:sigma-54-dependent Fis family transcriptional regulator [Zoogloea dura]|uniref:Sigma-54-dependent Fis family transcriptional regulator n=1 Tax=Zoogloea dura TaxID=2728840 RepID=A0A848G947_9RHOO|nr:sigma-54-dependent Fis family transcriptional regulator [Zoogloea dura]NML27425.1 sigma-54-dependent Fis family transcriptional regulator [Zoogloea dura]